MTIVGKILVFLNLVFSLVVGGFAVMDYTARTHWADSHAKLAQRVTVAEASGGAYKAENEKLLKEKQDLNDTLTRLVGKGANIQEPDKAARAVAQALSAAQTTVDNQKAEIAGLRSQLTAEKKKTVAAEANAQALVSDNRRRQLDVDGLRKTLKEETDKTRQLTLDKNEMRDRAVAAEISVTSLKDINRRLEEQLQEMAKDVARLRTSGGAGSRVTGPSNPPPDSVEGLVRRAEGNLVTISIGSDAGLQRGHTLEVFRLGQTPTYIGKVRIIEVTPTKAVGQAVGRMTVPMKVGDIVSSRIMPR
jgi:hypothetical protein